MWTKIAASIGLLSIGIAIGLFANLMNLGGNLDPSENNMDQDHNTYSEEVTPDQRQLESPNPRGEMTPEQWEEFTTKPGEQTPEQWDPYSSNPEEDMIQGSTSGSTSPN
ncbi:hypothetical protein B1B04_25140 [Lysinibacillus sp. KCTC 33748]|uniref:hypothetical protein n=1 Tax=unclassified Lysinibacillus TaxID=2636778 RepID=UPI0009A6838E|nr:MULTISPECIES: hypothetical protein [unclassified Lysinibacillus]OXS65302.1 hypothetical protein B1B04_25140 [Lysinibacillus sp. KCTC 33748]SKC20049.1 hypothetical protein SAMN06295926_1512 [Lysinibacillus sp. AC-3]